jgi:hypothetical protein
MQYGNDNLSEKGRSAVRRIKALRTLSERTGLITKNEQIQVLLSLDPDDMLAAADMVFDKAAVRALINGIGGSDVR